METKIIPTAKELLDYHTKQCKGTAKTAMIEFTKLHVRAALKAVSKNIKITELAEEALDAGLEDFDEVDITDIIDITSILNPYPLENIK